MNKKITPYCKKYPGAFIEFTGLVTPCCWFITTKEKHDYVEKFFGDDYHRLFITNSREDIINVYKRIEDSWTTDSPYQTCVDVCGDNIPSHPLKRKIEEQNIKTG